MVKYNPLKEQIKKVLSPKYGFFSFLGKIKSKDICFLDVGSGELAPYLKKIIPKSKYTGVDIIDYNPALHSAMERYIKTTPEKFPETIKALKNSIDIVFSNHNLEHCDKRIETLEAMVLSLRTGGKIFPAFPSERSVEFPSRRGTLNYFDDIQHKNNPPVFIDTVKTLENNGIKIEYKNNAYKPIFLFIIGMLLEPLAILLKKNMTGTWAFWGFEAVIWGKKER